MFTPHPRGPLALEGGPFLLVFAEPRDTSSLDEFCFEPGEMRVGKTAR